MERAQTQELREANKTAHRWEEAMNGSANVSQQPHLWRTALEKQDLPSLEFIHS